MSFRRRLLMSQRSGGPAPVVTPYTAEGLIFWVDGINNGSDPSGWTDLIGGKQFTSYGNVVRNADNFYFPGTSGSFMHTENGVLLEQNEDATVEVCYIPENASHSVLISGTDTNNPFPLFHKSSNKFCFIQRKAQYTYTLTLNSPYTLSFNLSSGLVNGSAATATSTDYWGNNVNWTNIGCRYNGTGNVFKGTIYSIRIYNRRLSSAEQLFNQQVDNTRFNLGLSI